MNTGYLIKADIGSQMTISTTSIII